jgi:poly(A) polymerase
MEEDKLRLLRAVRFAAVLDFQLDPATAEAVRRMAPQLVVVSAERNAQELRRMLINTHRRRAVQLSEELGLLQVMLPEVPISAFWTGTPPRVQTMLELLEQPSFELAFATLVSSLPPEPTVRGMCRKLRLSNHETTRIVWLVQNQTLLDDVLTFSQARLKRTLSHPGAVELVALARVRRLVMNADLQPVLFCEQYLRETSPDVLNPPPLVTGDDLIRLGWRPGPEFRPLLDQVRDAQLNGDLATKADGIELARRLHPPGDIDKS